MELPDGRENFEIGLTI